MNLRTFALSLLLGASALQAQTPEDPLAPWRSGVAIRPVDSSAERHSIHSYFNTCPESPDGTKVLYYTSTAKNGQQGELRVKDRQTGEEKVIAQHLSTEDAHRVACQQWASGGKRVVFHNERNGEWSVSAVDLESGQERVLAKDRLLSWGQRGGDLVPIYGKHWAPGEHRDLELVNVATGEIRKVLTADAVTAQYSEFITKKFEGKPISIFFPVLNADASRVFFKLASARNGNPYSSGASVREGLVAYDLAAQKFLFLRQRWGHPAWGPDNRTIVDTSFTTINSDNGKEQRTPGLPPVRGDHPTLSPDGKLFVTDSTLDRFGGSAKEWGIVLADARGEHHIVLHRFDNSQGARSWRPSHPHPVFSPDGRRLYFNVSDGPWTRLHVAEIAQP